MDGELRRGKKMSVDKSRVKETPCITIEAGEWFHYDGWEDYLCQVDVATYADQEELCRLRANRRMGYDFLEIEPYTPGNHDVFLWAEWDGLKDEKGRPYLVGDVEILEEYCHKAWDELVDILLEIKWQQGIIRIVNSTIVM